MNSPCADTAIIVLAAGAARRMRGRDKLLEPVEGQPLIARQATLARNTTTGPVIVTLPASPHARYDVLAGLDVTPLPVPDSAEGINASLRAGFAALPQGVTWAMVVLADLPALTLDDFNRMLQAIDPKSDCLIYRGATQSGKAGHPIVFHASLFPAFATLTGDTGGRDVIAAAQGRATLVPLAADHALLDLDTPEDWDAWHASQHPKA